MSDDEIHDDDMESADETDNESGGSASSSDVEPEEAIRARVESLVTGRERRSNAGTKMASLLSNLQSLSRPEEGDVYATAYGGFLDEEEDDDFQSDQEEADDELDSDFDVDESQEPEAEEKDEDDEGKKKRPKKTTKLAYEVAAERRARQEKETTKRQPASPRKKSPPKPKEVVTEGEKVAHNILSQRSLRTRRPAKRTFDDDEEETPKVKRSRPRHRKKKEVEKTHWTQEELLEEAKETEKMNLASLQKYQILELERNEAKKKARRTNREIGTSYIRFLSTTMPILENDAGRQVGKQEETFISFSDETAFQSTFPPAKAIDVASLKKKDPMHVRKGTAICPISGVQARYFDPATRQPYSSATTFRTLREAYCTNLEAVSNKEMKDASVSLNMKKDEELSTWLEWRKKEKLRLSTSSPSPAAQVK